MKSVLFSKKNTPDPELLALKTELRDAQSELAQAYHRFNQAVDPELVESWVFQINALNARCNYLIRAIKSRSPETIAAFSKTSAVKRHDVCGSIKPIPGMNQTPPQGKVIGYDVCEDEEDALWT